MDGDVTQFKMKRSAAWNARQDFKSLTEVTPMPMTACWEILQRFFVDSDIVESWTKALNKLFEKGETHLSEKQRMDFLSDSTIQFSKKATFELDPVSRLLVMGSGSEPETTSWFMRFPDCLVSNFKIPGTFGIIEGLPRTGKTSVAISFMKIIGEVLHQDVITNIVVEDPPEYYIRVKTLSELITKMVGKGKFTAILDETATYIPKKRALSGENLDFEALARFIGKWKGNLIVVTHSFVRDVPSLLQEWTTEKYKKIELNKMSVNLTKQNGFIHMNRLISGIPDSDFKFITEDTTALDFDISVSKMLKEIQNIEDYRNKPARIIEWIKDELNPHKKERSRIGIDIDDLLNNILSYQNKGFSKIQAIKKTADKMKINFRTAQTYYYTYKDNINK